MFVESKAIILKNGQGLLLKSPEPTDAKKMLEHLKIVFAESYRNMNYPANHWDNFSITDEEKILADYATSSSKFLLSAFHETRIVGNLGLFGSGPGFGQHSARIGMGIQREFCSIGLGTELMAHALDQARRLKFHRAELSVRVFNEAGIRLYEKMGFGRVGLLKDVALIDGEYFDEYLYQKILG